MRENIRSQLSSGQLFDRLVKRMSVQGILGLVDEPDDDILGVRS